MSYIGSPRAGHVAGNGAAHATKTTSTSISDVRGISRVGGRVGAAHAVFLAPVMTAFRAWMWRHASVGAPTYQLRLTHLLAQLICCVCARSVVREHVGGVGLKIVRRAAALSVGASSDRPRAVSTVARRSRGSHFYDWVWHVSAARELTRNSARRRHATEYRVLLAAPSICDRRSRRVRSAVVLGTDVERSAATPHVKKCIHKMAAKSLPPFLQNAAMF